MKLYAYDWFCFKQRTADEMRISDGSSDGCSSDLHGLEQLHARVRPLFGETLEALQQQPGRKHDLGGELDLGFPAGGETAGTTLQRRGFRQQGLRALVQNLSLTRQLRLAALNFEDLQAEQAFDLLPGLGYRCQIVRASCRE